MRLCGSVAALALAAHACPSAQAAQVGGDGGQGQKAEAGTEIVVTARRRNEAAQTVPIAITTFSAEQLEQQQVRQFADIQGLTPSLNIQQGSGGSSVTQIAIRGQSQSDPLLTSDPAVGVYIDDVVFARQFGLRSAFVDVAQVEVLKGPQGTLFGRNTTGGAVLIQTRKPDLEAIGGFADLRLGNYDFVQAEGALNVPLVPGKVAIRMAGQVVDRRGFGESLVTGQDIGDEDGSTARIHLLAEPGAGLRILLSADHTRIGGHGQRTRLTTILPFPDPSRAVPAYIFQVLAEEGLADTPANRILAQEKFIASARAGGFYDNSSGAPLYLDVEVYGASANISADLGAMTLRSITAHRWIDRDETLDFDATQYVGSDGRYAATSRNFTQELQLLGQVGRLEWIVGAFYNREHGDEENSGSLAPLAPFSPSPIAFLGRVVNKSYAGFAQGNYRIGETLRATLGFRYTREEKSLTSMNRMRFGCLVPVALRQDPAICSASFEAAFEKPSYLVGLDWTPRPGTLLYASTSYGFRGGGQNFRGTNLAGFSTFLPETARNYEIGFKADFLERRLRVNAAAYYTDYRNVQKNTATLVDGIIGSAVRNAAGARIKGVELEVTANPLPNLTLAATGSYTRARYREFVDLTGDRSDEAFPVPAHTFSLSGTYEIPVGDEDGVTLSADYRWLDDVNFKAEVLDDAGVTQPAYGLLNARIAYHLQAPGVELALWARNLADVEYYAGAIGQDIGQGYNEMFGGAPRTFGVQVRKRFGGG